MLEQNVTISVNAADTRADWATPTVVTMIAGEAENGSGTVQDDPFSNS